MDIDRTLSKSNLDLTDRKYSKKINYKYQKDFTTIFTLPEGYKVSYIPEESSFDHPDYNFKINYETKGNQIIQHKKITVNTLSVVNKDFESWNDRNNFV